MNIKNILAASTAAFALSLGATSHAATFAGCVSTDMVDFDGTVVDAAIATPELSTLVDAVVAAGLDGALAEAENITVFAPTNDAFAALPPGVLEAVASDVDVLTAVLTYHVTEGEEDPRKWVRAERAQTLAGAPVFFHRQSGEARVNSAAVTCQGVKTDNGSVWLIDTVLLP